MKVSLSRRVRFTLLAGAVLVLGLAILFTFRNNADSTGERPREEVTSDATFGGRFQNGDIIFHISRSSQSKAIQLATGSRYSHMGIIYENGDERYVYEAVQPVQMTKLDRWIDRGEGAHYVVKRLKDSERLLTPTNLERLKKSGERFKGRSYDIYFEWSDDKIYCSELVWKMYKEALGIEIGKLQELREFDLSNAVVRNKMKERYGDNIPLKEKVISPAAMFDSDKLVTIEDR